MKLKNIALDSWLIFNKNVNIGLFLAKLYVFPFLVIYAFYLLFTGQTGSTDLWLFAIFYIITMLGITIGFHRLVTHDAFKAHPAVRFIFIAFGAIAGQGPVTYWATAHLKHHSTTDKEGDPHSPVTHGFGYSHYKWQMKTDWASLRDKYKKRFENDRMLVFFDKTALLWILLGAAIPFAVGGWSGLLWGFVVRVFFNNHVVWLVNSWGHTFGNRDFDTRDNSRNNFWLAILSCGEGWHNNHHAQPRSAFHGMKWWQVDFSSYIIILLEKLGLVTDVVRPRTKRTKVQEEDN